jgi:CubicO group peptidase (beta-lactamase class C family)
MRNYLLLFIFCSHAAFSQLTHKNTIDKSVEDYMQLAIANDYFSGTILIAKEGKIQFQKAYGKASLELNVPNNINTKYSIASITKSFTALAIMQLVEKEKLKLTDSFCLYVSNCPDVWKPITIQQLLTHTSGIMNFSRLPDWDEFHKKQSYTSKELVNLVREIPLKFAPGEKYNYSNTGYVLLGLVIEKVSGLTFADFINQNILDKIGTKNTGGYNNVDIISGLATGYYHKIGIPFPVPYENLELGNAAGFMYSTVADLLLYDQALYTEKLLSKKSIEQMFTPYKDNYGFGWEIKEVYNRKMIGHSGSNNGFSAYLMRYPEEKITVIVLSNSDKTRATKIAYDLSAILFDQPFKAPAKNVFDTLVTAYHQSGVEAVIQQSQTSQVKDKYDLLELLGEFAYDLLDLRRYDDSIKLFTFLVAQYKDSSFAHDYLGEAYLLKGNYPLAKQYFEKALELDTENEYAIKGLKKVNEKLKTNN